MKTTNSSSIYSMLCAGKVKFQYRKKDGSIRSAIGTLNPDMITKKPMGGNCLPKEAGYMNYFDLEKNGFRCFLESNVLSYEMIS